nr:calcium-binding protein [Gallibacterium anatis]
MKALNDDVTAKKAAAQQEVNKLPDGDVKDGFNGRLGDVDTVTVPPVTDANNDGVKDSDAAAAEADALKALNDDVTAKKAAAQQEVNKLPDGDVKDGFNGRLGDVDTVTVPPVTPIEPLAFDSESKTPAVSAANGDKVILNLNGNATSDHPADTFDGNKATLIFGDATSPTEKVHTLTGAGNGRIAVYNPKLDWDMRTSDDGTGTQQDHAPGWGYDEEALRRDAGYNNYNPDDNRAYFYKWTGASDAADIILVENVQTDPDNGDTKVQGMIASEAKGSETKQVRFALDTLAGGNDYIKAKGVGGHVKIKTNEGDDVIELGYMNGRKGVGVPFYDGSNQIDMGEGNDKLLVTSHSGDQGVWQLGYDNGSLYYTNAKIDMGEGDNEVSIYQNIIAGAEGGSGNYIRFGSGNDKLTVGGYIGGESASVATGYKSSNIIDLGGGHNTVQVGGIYTSDTTKFLMVSDGSSNVTFNSYIGGRSSMMMGDGDDTVVVKGNAEFNSDPYYWLDGAFIKNMEEGAKNDMYKGFYETAFKQKVSDKLVSAIDRAGAGSEAVLGAKGLNPNETNIDNARSIGTRIDLGNGENTLSITGSVLRLNYLGGTDSDTVTLGRTLEESNFWMGDGNNTLSSSGSVSKLNYRGGVDSDTVTLGATSESRFWMGDGTNTLSLGSSSSIGYSGGTGTDTITINGSVNNNSTFNIGSGDNSIKITGNAEQTWIGVSNNDQGFAQSGNDTVTIGGNFIGKGTGSEVINLGAGQDSVTISGKLQDSSIQMGDGNDSVTIRGTIDGSNIIDAGKGDDVITVTSQINSRNTQLIGGEGNDTFTVQYFKGDNQNAVSGGTGKDTLNITGNLNSFIVGWRSGWTNLWSIEEIVFKGSSSNNTIRIEEKSLTEDNDKSLYIKNQSTGSNTVALKVRGSQTKTTQYEDRDSNGQDEAHHYTVYKFDGGYKLYIEDGINII